MSETPNPTNDLMNDLLKDPFDQSAPVVTEEASPQAETSIINKLSPEQQAQAEQLAQQLDVNDQQAVLN